MSLDFSYCSSGIRFNVCRVLSIVENISEGSCIVQTNNGVVDASIEAQLEIVQNALRSS